MLNLSILALSLISHKQYSPFFASTDNILFQNSKFIAFLSPSILSFGNLKVTNSYFSKFLETPIIFQNAVYSETQEYSISADIASSTFQQCQGTNGGAIYIAASIEYIRVARTIFAYCTASAHGGAINCEYDLNSFTFSSSRTTFCSASDGSIFYITSCQTTDINNNIFENSGPSRRPGIFNSILLKGNELNLNKCNFSECSSLKASSSFNFDVSEKLTIDFASLHRCRGENIVCLNGIAPSVSISNLNFYNSSAGSEGLVFGKGLWEVTNSIFIFNQGIQATVEYGHITFINCLMDSPYFFSEYVSFENCVYSIHDPNAVFRETSINVVGQFHGDDKYPDDDDIINENPDIPARTTGFSFSLSGILSLVAAGLVIILIILAIVTFKVVKKHRKHVIHVLHEVYADEAEIRNNQNNQSQNSKEKDRIDEDKVNNSSNDGNTEGENELDDLYQFRNVTIPNTFMWDTDDGDMEVVNERPFLTGNFSTKLDEFEAKNKHGKNQNKEKSKKNAKKNAKKNSKKNKKAKRKV
ncbi:hypothetical protein TRFO_39987 [Tritrichomonas foetus]|uniref:Uncharacterized protein n=1 Tax=Tritrichomonas foetus TaxID=1144522 RepID=A0A1J4J6D2_9EUKA|nr:hypothetical protein TRFO_39987 [Tritrichomonas foetus]|eukprot:OHS93719.1 hypothetical protein TRFO_39987 [Tritrichomonas foetus]